MQPRPDHNYSQGVCWQALTALSLQCSNHPEPAGMGRAEWFPRGCTQSCSPVCLQRFSATPCASLPQPRLQDGGDMQPHQCQDGWESFFHNACCSIGLASPRSPRFPSISGEIRPCTSMLCLPGSAGTATRDRFHTQSVSQCKNSTGSATSPALSEESQGPLK